MAIQTELKSRGGLNTEMEKKLIVLHKRADGMERFRQISVEEVQNAEFKVTGITWLNGIEGNGKWTVVPRQKEEVMEPAIHKKESAAVLEFETWIKKSMDDGWTTDLPEIDGLTGIGGRKYTHY
jgi:hypothetical protein